jgi:hypothetical protein
MDRYIDAIKVMPELCADIFQISNARGIDFDSDACYLHVHAPGQQCDVEEDPW